ncbi:hypothetical protein OPV22_022147 [Ensete ventricosum]|uniref:Uncharacterized protein n=1 Tax=Ensete ventricosum TaxID=4639 RepID=A0AAV8QRX2_ENSVE|nr:hypothetical protein OPV22_022147 [Ensete ventricosum]
MATFPCFDILELRKPLPCADDGLFCCNPAFLQHHRTRLTPPHPPPRRLRTPSRGEESGGASSSSSSQNDGEIESPTVLVFFL